jgi:hypothetical protein
VSKGTLTRRADHDDTPRAIRGVAIAGRRLKEFRRVVTRYEKLKETFFGMAHLALGFIRLKAKLDVNRAHHGAAGVMRGRNGSAGQDPWHVKAP